MSLTAKIEALESLVEIQDQLASLAHEVFEIISCDLPDYLANASAYDIWSFGRSSNPYDETLAKLVERVKEDIKAAGGSDNG